jgi:hypothetical protein
MRQSRLGGGPGRNFPLDPPVAARRGRAPSSLRFSAQHMAIDAQDGGPPRRLRSIALDERTSTTGKRKARHYSLPHLPSKKNGNETRETEARQLATSRGVLWRESTD